MRVIDWKRSATGFRSNSPGVQISATSAKFRITACSRSSMSSLTRSSRNVTDPPRRARSIRARNSARSNRMGAAVGFEAMPVGTLAAPSLAILRLSMLPTSASLISMDAEASPPRSISSHLRGALSACRDAFAHLPRLALDIALPTLCVSCREPVDGEGVCAACWAKLSFIAAAVLSAARHSLRLRSRSGIAVDGGNRQPTGVPARPRRGAL